MNLDSFNDEYYPFNIDVGYSLKNISPVTKEELQQIDNDLERGLNARVKRGFRSRTPQYFLILSGYGSKMAIVPVYTDDLDQEVPPEIFKIVENYQPPVFD